MIMRPYRRWTSPLAREMEQLRRDMNRLLADFPASHQWRMAPGYPAVNIWTTEECAILTAELAGVALEDIEIAVENDTLTLNGNRKPDDVEEGAAYHRQERRYGSFARTVRLPFRVDPGKVEARLRNGVLTITLPCAEAEKPKKIMVKAG
jgi:HSP20 family protein